LPGPPFLFISRIVSVDTPSGEMTVGSRLVVEYDIPDDPWYRQGDGYPVMPLAVLMEVALQPCGWLATHVGCVLASEEDVRCRNLDGSGSVLGEVPLSSRTMRTEVTLQNISRHAGMTIASFDVECRADGIPVFGYFPPASFAEQTGLPGPVEFPGPARPVDRPTEAVRIPEGLAGPELLMLDRITGYWPHGGRAGLGRIVAEKDVDADEWFFKAHFYQDPVQPGSLGLQAMCQLLQTYMIERGLAEGLPAPRWEAVAVGQPIRWKYRGQVTPENQKITIELELLRVESQSNGGVLASADAWLWADETRIYHVPGLTMRFVPAEPAPALSRGGSYVLDELLDPATESWLADHCPTWTVPVLPAMSLIDRMVAAAHSAGHQVPGIRDFRVHRWLTVPGPTLLRTQVTETSDGVEVSLLQWREARHSDMSRFETIATAWLAEPQDRPLAWPEPEDTVAVENPYASGAVMHGKAFQYLLSLHVGNSGSVAVLDAGAGTVPFGALHQGLLDGLTHCLPHSDLGRWFPGIGRDVVGYPTRLDFVRFHEPLPTEGEIHILARPAGFHGSSRAHPVFDIQACLDGRVLVDARLVDTLVPLGPLAALDDAERRAFLRDRAYVGGVGLSITDGGVTRVSAIDVAALDWLPGTVAGLYHLPDGISLDELLSRVAVQDHVARIMKVHPDEVHVSADLSSATVGDLVHHVSAVVADGVAQVSSRQDRADG
jgi:3-hydroxymyristoyl/3-hydroxydecanoyl-(acyl carrier protein) dehydratase